MEVVKALLQANGSIETKDEDGDTALHYTAFGWEEAHIYSCQDKSHASRASAARCTWALSYGKSLFLPYYNVFMALIFFFPFCIMFCFSNQAEIARLLLSKGANVNILNNSMCTALHIAVNKGFTDLVRLLTEHSADVNLQVRFNLFLQPTIITRDFFSCNPLHVALPIINTCISPLQPVVNTKKQNILCI